MLIYRVEHSETGSGPFMFGFDKKHLSRSGVSFYNEAKANSFDPRDHPAPVEAGLQHVNFFEFFGCESIQQLLEWFPDQAGRLAMGKVGFVVRVYQIDASFTRRGKMQVLFELSKAIKIASLPMDDPIAELTRETEND